MLLQTEASFESEALVRCLAPPLLAPGTARVRVSINGGDSFATEEDLARPDWTPRGDGGIFLGYDSRQPPALVAVEPSWSDAEGGSVLVVSARNLAPTARLACHFDQVGSSAATLLNATALSCVAPAAVPQTTLLRLTLDGDELSSSGLAFTYHDASRPPSLVLVEPNQADARGTALLTLWGSNFPPADNAAMACLFESAPSAAYPPSAASLPSAASWRAATPATIASADRVRCLSPHIDVTGGAAPPTGSGTVRRYIPLYLPIYHLYLLISPFISRYLPISPYISRYLPRARAQCGSIAILRRRGSGRVRVRVTAGVRVPNPKP